MLCLNSDNEFATRYKKRTRAAFTVSFAIIRGFSMHRKRYKDALESAWKGRSTAVGEYCTRTIHGLQEILNSLLHPPDSHPGHALKSCTVPRCKHRQHKMVYSINLHHWASQCSYLHLASLTLAGKPLNLDRSTSIPSWFTELAVA